MGSSSPRVFLALFVTPIILSIGFNLIFAKPPLDHGKGTMFDLIATRYDFINRALALNLDIGWRKTMISHVTSHGHLFDNDNDKEKEKEPLRILDLATGTADVAILFAKEYQNHKNPTPRDLHILGVDPSQNMIGVGREKISNQDLTDHITLQLGDARNLNGLQNDTFHAATMSFGIRNVPEKEMALCEIHRVLKKEKHGNGNGKHGNGATLAILEFSEPGDDAGIMGKGARFFIRHVVPVIGAVLSGAPREYMHLQNSIKEFPSPQQFVALMEGLQCTTTHGAGNEHEDEDEDGDGDEHEDGNDRARVGSYRVDDLIQLNFGSVQLYLATPIYTH